MKRNMKTMKMMWALLLLAVPVMLTSCDDREPYWFDNYDYGGNYRGDDRPGSTDDEDFCVNMAQTLAGQWSGELMAYELDTAGVVLDSLLYSTDIEFKQYNSKSISGTGTQYDYEITTDTEGKQHIAVEPFTRNFTWYIDPNNGTIYLTYKEQQSDGTTNDYVMTIAYDDLNLDDRTFTGYLWSADGAEVDDFWFDRYTGESNAKSAQPVADDHKVVKLKLVMR
jgi:hypothetical protein